MTAAAPELRRAIEAVAARLRLVRGLRAAATTAVALLFAVGVAMLLAKANVAVPRVVLAATAGAIGLVSMVASSRRGPGVPEAAWLLDRRAGGAERFATWLELPEGDPFRPALERECRTIAARVETSALVPVRLPRTVPALAGAAILLCIVALVVPRAGDAERARNRAEGNKVRAAVGEIASVPGRDAAELRQDLLLLAAALDKGQLDPAELARALREARRAADGARALAAVPETLAELAREVAALERLAGAFELGAREGEAGKAAAALARAVSSHRSPVSGAEPTERMMEHPVLAPLARAIEAGHASRAAAEAEKLKAEAAGAADVRVALAGATARLEAAARKLGVDPSSQAPPSADPGARSPEPELERSLPPRIEMAVRRYFTDQEVPR